MQKELQHKHPGWVPTQQELTSWRNDCLPAIATVVALPQALTFDDLMPSGLDPASSLYLENKRFFGTLAAHTKKCVAHVYKTFFEEDPAFFTGEAFRKASNNGYTPETYVYALALQPDREILTSAFQRFDQPLDTVAVCDDEVTTPPTTQEQMETLFWQLANKEIFFRASTFMQTTLKALFLGARSREIAIQQGKLALCPLSFEEKAPLLLGQSILPSAAELREHLLPSRLTLIHKDAPSVDFH